MQRFTLDPNQLTNIALIIAILVFLGILSLRVALVYAYTEDLGGVEQDEIYTLQRVLAGYPVYEDPEQPPFSITQKTPLYHYLCYGIGKFFNISSENPRSVYLLNRWTSLILSLCTILLGFWMQRRLFQTNTKIALIVCALMFICFEPHMFCRPDSLYSFLFLLTATSLCHYSNRKNFSMKLLGTTSLLCALTIFTKQSGIILPLIIGGYLILFEKSWKEFLIFTVGFTLIFIIFFYLLKWGSNTQVFLANVYRGVNNGIELGWFRDAIYNKAFKKFSIIFIIGWLIIIDWLYIKNKNSKLKQVIAFCLLMSFVFALSTALKTGSTASYFTDFNNLALIVTPFYRKSITDLKPPLAIRVRTLSFLLFAVLIPLNTSAKNLFLPFKNEDKEWFYSCKTMMEYAQKNLDISNANWIYTDDEVLKLYLFHHALLPQDDIYMTSPFAYALFWNALKDGSVPYIISQNPIDEVFALEADLSNYKQVDKFEMFYIYQFQPE